MKFLTSQLAYLTTDREARGNLRALAKHLAFLGVLVSLYAILFHVIKQAVEQEQHSWITGFYRTLVVMTTLGFGDITFTSDIGRLFSIVVLLSGVVFYRRPNPHLRIVSRITHERNLEAIHRAGADFVLSYTTLGIEALLSVLRGQPPVLLGEGVELFAVRIPSSLAGRPLGESGIGSRTGLSVVALQKGDDLIAPLTSETLLASGMELIMLGSDEQRAAFQGAFGKT